MRLRDIQALLHLHLEHLKVADSAENVPLPTSQMGSRIPIRAAKLREAAQALRVIPGLQHQLDIVAGAPVVLHTGSDALVDGPHDQVQPIHQVLKATYQSARELLQLLDQMLPPQDSLSIGIKLPPVDSLGDLAKTVQELELIFDQTARRVVGDGVRFQGLDRGSSWVEVVAHTGLVLFFVAGLVDKAYRYTRKVVGQRQADQVYEELGAFSDDVRAAASQGLKKLAREWSSELVEGHARAELSPTDRAEAVVVTTTALEKLSDMFLRTAEVRLAIAAPEAAKDVAPSPKSFDELKRLLQPSAALLADTSTRGLSPESDKKS